MTREPEEIGEIDLMALADGFLDADPERKAEVERHLETSPEDASFVAEIREQNEAIRRHYDIVLNEPVPERVQRMVFGEPPRRLIDSLWRGAAVAVLLLAATAGGWLLGQHDVGRGGMMDRLIVQAATWPDQLSQPGAMTSELDSLAPPSPLSPFSKRVVLELEAPDLSAAHFELIDKQVLRPRDDPTVRLAYGRADGTVINLLLKPRWEAESGPIGRAEINDTTVLYWHDGPLAFAMTTNAAEEETGGLVRSVHDAVEKVRLNEDGTPSVAEPLLPIMPVLPTTAPDATDDGDSLAPTLPLETTTEEAATQSELN